MCAGWRVKLDQCTPAYCCKSTALPLEENNFNNLNILSQGLYNYITKHFFYIYSTNETSWSLMFSSHVYYARMFSVQCSVCYVQDYYIITIFKIKTVYKAQRNTRTHREQFTSSCPGLPLLSPW